MKIKEAETLTGLPSKTIKYYEDEGLIFPERNKENNYRSYNKDDIEKLRKIRLFRKLGLSISSIKKILLDSNSLKEILNEQIKEIDENIETQSRIKNHLNTMLKNEEVSKEIDFEKYLCEILEEEQKGYKYMNENVREKKFKKDSRITLLFVISFLLLMALSVFLLAEKIINIYIYLVIVIFSLFLLVLRHSKTTGYVCKNCGGRFNITPIIDFVSPHMTDSKYLKCPHCGKKTWAKESYRAEAASQDKIQD